MLFSNIKENTGLDAKSCIELLRAYGLELYPFTSKVYPFGAFTGNDPLSKVECELMTLDKKAIETKIV